MSLLALPKMISLTYTVGIDTLGVVLFEECLMLMEGPGRSAVRQLSLFESDADQSASTSESEFAFSDPAFNGNKILPIHRWVPWIAGFSSEFVGKALEQYLSAKGTVLDPFAGVGTTLVEAVLQGHDAVGFEINPYAAFACRTKLTSHSTSIEKLQHEISSFQDFFAERILSGYTPTSEPPKAFKTRAEFYSPKVLRKVLILHDFINTIKDDGLRDLFRLAFASTMIVYSNYSYEPSLGRRVSAGKKEILDFPVAETITQKLRDMEKDSTWFRTRLKRRKPKVSVINESFFQCSNYLNPDSVDLLITSPPYLNNYHYNRNTRPHLYWLGYADWPKALNRLEDLSFGKFWQTAREAERIDLEFKLANTDMEERLEHLRRLNPEKGIYGGNGWANYAATYFNDCYRFAEMIKYCVKPGGTALIVIGNSILQGVEIPTDQYLGAIAEAVGLQLAKIDIPRATRVGNSVIQSSIRVGKAKDSHQLYEAVVELRKKQPGCCPKQPANPLAKLRS